MKKNNYEILIKNFISNFGTGCSKEEMVTKVHHYLCGQNINNSILNDRYIEIDTYHFEFIRKRSIGAWIVKSF